MAVRYGAQMDQSGYRRGDAALVIVGAATMLLGTASVILSPSLSSSDPAGDFRQALLVGLGITVAGVACWAVGLLRAIHHLRTEELPPPGLWGAVAGAGTLSLILGTRTALGWLSFYPPSDPRAQPTHVIGAMLFFGAFSTVFAVVGTVMLVFGLVRAWRSSRDVGEH
jgi:hypothetical protein